MNPLPTSPSASDKTTWPLRPYKGLDYYEAEDRPLFAGRSTDVLDCATRLTASGVRILALHGNTGCGKSSFLRAGLIPFLEARGRGFSFVREHGNPMRALFARSTQAPLVGLARAVHTFVSEPPRSGTSPASEGASAGHAIQDIGSIQDFVAKVRHDAGELRMVLASLSRVLPATLVLVVDQLEEVLTLKPGEEGEADRSAFFEFLAILMQHPLDIKIILTMRTEYVGRILNELDAFIDGKDALAQFFLSDLADDEMIEAIERPASDQPVDGLSAPRKNYMFSLEGDLARTIVRDLRGVLPTGGALPVMQIICGRLYFSMVEDLSRETEIKLSDYRRLGRVEDQIDRYLTEGLVALCVDRGLSMQDTPSEVRRWKGLVLTLARHQVDGTVTSDIVSATEMNGRAKGRGMLIPFDVGGAILSTAEPRILRKVEVFNAAARREVPAYALGHDAIGLAIRAAARIDEAVERKAHAQRGHRIAEALTALCVANACMFGAGGLGFDVNLSTALVLDSAFVAIMYGLFSADDGNGYFARSRRFLAAGRINPLRDIDSDKAYARLSSERRKRGLLAVKKRLIEAAHTVEDDETWRVVRDEALHLIDRDEADLGIWINLARGQRRKGKGNLDDAIGTLTKAISRSEHPTSVMDRNHSILYFNRACYYALRLRNGSMSKDFERCLEDMAQCLRHAASPSDELKDMFNDPDFNEIVKTHEFRALVARSIPTS